MKHRSIVSLVGFCDELGEQILVYQYMPNGSLKARLANKGRWVPWPPKPLVPHLLKAGSFFHPLKLFHYNLLEADIHPLSFCQRLQIALGAAQGLHHLHNFSSPGIIHRDVKSDNILLDENLQVAISREASHPIAFPVASCIFLEFLFYGLYFAG